MRKHPFCPNGRAVSDVIVYTFTSRGAEIDASTGEVSAEDHSAGDLPELDVYTMVGGDVCVQDCDGTEFLDRHCRIVEVWEAFDESTDEIDAWPDEIVELCIRVLRLESGLVELKHFEQFMPQDFRNPITAAVLDDILRRHIQEDIVACEAKIAAFRKGRVEVTKLEEPEDAEPA